MSRKEGAFHLLTGPSDEWVRRQVEMQFDLPRHSLTNEDIERKYDGRGGYLEDFRRPRVGEDMQLLDQRTEVLLDISPPRVASYGLSLLSYRDGLREQSRREGGREVSHKALLLGAYTTDTIHEFAVTVRDVHPTAECHVVDIEGHKTAEVSPDKVIFRQESALQLSTPDAEMDSVHSNNLLRMLKDPLSKEQDFEENGRRIYKEARRVLRPGGVLLMVENNGIGRDFVDNLYEAGFGHVLIGPTRSFLRRKEMEQFMRSTADEPLPRAAITDEYGPFIIATRPYIL